MRSDTVRTSAGKRAEGFGGESGNRGDKREAEEEGGDDGLQCSEGKRGWVDAVGWGGVMVGGKRDERIVWEVTRVYGERRGERGTRK